MDKVEFLKVSEAGERGSAASNAAQGQEPAASLQNWAGNLTYGTGRLHVPASDEELRRVVQSCAKLRVIGTRHSFNGIADSSLNLVSLKKFDRISLDENAKTVTVGAAVTYGALAPLIDARGYALHNLASLPHISVAGAVATATHGSGVHNGNLATAVEGLELMLANGETLALSRQKDGGRFLAAVVGLGALGVVTSLTLNLQPTFLVAQSAYENLSFDRLEDHFDEIFSGGYSVSLFTDWQNHQARQVWIKRRLAAADKNEWGPEFFGARLATRKLHPVPGHDAEACSEQHGIAGPWYERLPHFRMNFTPSSGRELQTEYFVPRERGYEAILAVEKLRSEIAPHLLVTELRMVAADELWMSTAYRRDSLALHFTWKPDWPEVSKILPQIEKQLEPFGLRTHWGKLFTIPPAGVQAQYEKLADFKALAEQLDPQAKFRNEFLNGILYSN
jgi:xylitol oxidase